jgi:hypothetical protein
MATSVTQSLFGITPQSIQAQRDAEMQQQALAFARLSPMESARMGLFQGVNQLGNAFGQLTGVEDTEIAQARQRQGMLGGLDVSDPNALRQAAQNADPQTASMLVTRAMELEKGSAEIDAQQALVNQRNREARINFGSDREAISKAIYGKTFNDLLPAEAAAVNEKAAQEAAAKTPKTTVNVGGPDIKGILQEVSAKQDAIGKAENWAKAGDAYKMQVPMLAQLDEVTQLLPRTFTGSFANTSLQFGKALSGMGIPIDENKLTNTEYLNAVSAQLLQTIARNFPGALAVKEMDQLIKSKPNSQQQVTTIVKILDGLKKEMKSNVIAYEQLAKLPESERYGKNFNIVQADAFRKLTRYESLVKKAQQAKADTSGKTRLTKEEIAEAQSLQQELGEK